MNPESASALVWSSAILILLGGMALDPALRLLLFVLAAVCGAAPGFFCAGRVRAAGLVALAIAGALALAVLPASLRHIAQHGERARNWAPRAQSQRAR